MWEHVEGYIPLDKCLDGHLYRVLGRNLTLGIYWNKHKSFIYVRNKFGDRFLDTEVHWDADDNFGTCKPMEDLGFAMDLGEDCPLYGGDDEKREYNVRIFDFLDAKMTEMRQVRPVVSHPERRR